ncbi:MAG: hypothetical protein ACI4XC_03905 [Eubacterium sp.]
MKVFLIILAVLAVIIIAVLSLSVTLTVVYDKGWHTKAQILFIEKDIVLSKILSFILFPEKKAEQVADESKKKKKNKKAEKDKQEQEAAQSEEIVEETAQAENKPEQEKPAEKKPNPIKKLWDNEGIVGIMSLVSNVLETANSAVTTLIRGLHIYSLYVMILVGGPDADMIARSYGTLCKYYYPLKGMILNGMKVDNYDDYIQPDFIADRTEVEFQIIVSINVALLLKVALKAGFVFLKNLIKNKKGD